VSPNAWRQCAIGSSICKQVVGESETLQRFLAAWLGSKQSSTYGTYLHGLLHGCCLATL